MKLIKRVSSEWSGSWKIGCAFFLMGNFDLTAHFKSLLNYRDQGLSLFLALVLKCLGLVDPRI